MASPRLQAVLCSATRRVHDHLDRPLPPNGSEPVPYFDLRQAITQLQLDRKPSVPLAPETEAKSDIFDDLGALSKAFNYRSYADAWVDHRHWAKLDVSPVCLVRRGRGLTCDLGYRDRPVLSFKR